ncbi:major capsid protein [Peribacillus frigoritolerans]|uniref:Phage major capsid protein n=1 Tax=Peribacillus frigoritolerans TaxID=450367 RepID=A0AAJ1QKN6_9BACI|nr:phage major capsid protein [Peribacillus frigoritolerans]MDM5283112.1 phage major capsid protein [Peribacillus frigoritolerans]
MSVTLDQAHLLSSNTLQKGVVQTFARTSPVLELLPFMTISGNSYQYNVEKTLPRIDYREIGFGYEEGGGTVEQRSDSLVMLGGDVDVDVFVHKTLGNINNQRAIQTEMKSKAVAKQFTNTFFKGNTDAVTGDPLSFNGIDARLAQYAPENDVDAVGSALSVSMLHELLDLVAGGASVIFMTKKTRRALQALLEGSLHYIDEGRDTFGRKVELFGGVEIRVMELGYGVNDGELYAMRFGVEEAVSGLMNGGVMVSDLGQITEKPVYRTRIEFYCGLAVFNPKTAARIYGLTV